MPLGLLSNVVRVDLLKSSSVPSGNVPITRIPVYARTASSRTDTSTLMERGESRRSTSIET